jgi:hypothetical protein
MASIQLYCLARLVMTGRVTMLGLPGTPAQEGVIGRCNPFCDGDTVGHAVVGTFSAPRVLAREGLPAG